MCVKMFSRSLSKKSTKWGLLSRIATLFDPLQFLATYAEGGEGVGVGVYLE